MSKVVLSVSISLDGFATGPNVSDAHPMGEGGEHLHHWMFAKGPETAIDTAVRQDIDASVGAALIGRRTFDLGLPHWGGTPWPKTPSFVVTHRVQDDLVGQDGGTFCFTGLEAAVGRAKEAAGDKDVLVLGIDVARQLLSTGHLDELHLHIVPIVLGAGTPLFNGEKVELIPEGTPVMGTVPHLRLRVAKGVAS